MRNETPNLVGARVRCIHMNDPHPVPEGTEGTVRGVDDLGTLHVRWDNGQGLGLVPGEDRYEILTWPV